MCAYGIRDEYEDRREHKFAAGQQRWGMKRKA
jgi:hypothetical protein